MWCAIYLPSDAGYSGLLDSTRARRGFKTREEAWDFIESRRCGICKTEARDWLIRLQFENKEDIDPEEWPLYSCDAEWDVCLEEEWDDVCREAYKNDDFRTREYLKRQSALDWELDRQFREESYDHENGLL